MFIKRFEKNRWFVFNTIVEVSFKEPAFGFIVDFSSQEWEIVTCIGFGFGRIWFSTPNKFLFRAFRDVFNGKGFGEWGREIGFMITKKWAEYSLWWWSDINKPRNTWRNKTIFYGL